MECDNVVPQEEEKFTKAFQDPEFRKARDLRM